MKAYKKSIIVILFIGLTSLQCHQLIIDETNFSRPSLARCRTIAVPASSYFGDMYLAETLTNIWPGIEVVGPDSIAARLEVKGTMSLREIGADAVILQSVSTHHFSPSGQYFDPRTRTVVHITTFVVDLTTNDTLACYHNEGSYWTYTSNNGDYQQKKLERIVKANIKGLVKLAKSSDHLSRRTR